jgi:hypothetical protein
VKARTILAALALLFAARASRAAEHVVAPPRAREVAVPYPAGGRGDAVVVLELVVGDDGRVRSFRVLAGAEPFLGAAKRAAPSFRFEPATRDGRPIAARMRVELPFHENAPPPPPRIERVERVAARPKPVKKLPPIAGVEEVHVRGVRKEIGGTAMTKEDVRDLPGAFGDAFRAIDMMPGVTPILSGVPFFFVRGAPPGNTGYYIDGVRVPLLYHLALGPSVIHPSLIERVDFYPGGYPAPYGRFTGGIVAGETRGPSSRLGGEAEVRLFDTGVLGEAPFAHGKGDALVAGRFGYPALLVPLIAPGTSLSYWDYQGRASYRVAPRDTITAFVFGSFDELDTADAIEFDAQGNPTKYGPYRPLFRTEFHRADFRWDHAIRGGNLRTALTLGIDDSLAGGGGSDSERVQAESIQLRTELERRLTRNARLRAGADVLLYHYDYTRTQTFDQEPVSLSFPARNDVIFGGYGDVVWQVHPRVEIVPGLRFDVFTSRAAGDVDPNSPLSLVTGGKATAAPALDPRLGARVEISHRLTWVGTLGLMHQPPSFAAPVPGGELGSLSNGLQSAVQASQGFEAKLPWALELKGTLFLQRYFGMTNAFASCSSIFNDLDVSCLDARVNGRGVGVEVMLRRSFSKRIGGWISYTFSRSTVEVPHPVLGEASEVPSNFDRTHVLNVAVAFNFGKGYHAGARFTYYTGLPYTAQQDGVPVPPFNGYRLPDFWRLDLRLEKRWRLGKRGQLALVLEGLNITFNKEAVGVNCINVIGQKLDQCNPQMIGPVSVPSLGVEVKY